MKCISQQIQISSFYGFYYNKFSYHTFGSLHQVHMIQRLFVLALGDLWSYSY